MPLPDDFWNDPVVPENLDYQGALRLAWVQVNRKQKDGSYPRLYTRKELLEVWKRDDSFSAVLRGVTDSSGLPWSDKANQEHHFRSIDDIYWVNEDDPEKAVLVLCLDTRYWLVIKG